MKKEHVVVVTMQYTEVLGVTATSLKEAEEMVYASHIGDDEDPLYEEWIAESIYDHYGSAKPTEVKLLYAEEVKV
jgi:hypothetical protein